jgi:hypothetical protein
MNDIREKARIKYEKYKLEKDAEQAKIYQENATKELKLVEEVETDNLLLQELQQYITDLNGTTDIFSVLQLIQEKLTIGIKLIIDHGRLPEIQDCILIFVHAINKSHEYKKNDIAYVTQVGIIIKDIFEMCQIDIEIEQMDTSKDNEIAQKLQEEMYNL